MKECELSHGKRCQIRGERFCYMSLANERLGRANEKMLNTPSAILVNPVQCPASTDLHAISWRASTSNGVYLAARSTISTCQFKPLLSRRSYVQHHCIATDQKGCTKYALLKISSSMRVWPDQHI